MTPDLHLMSLCACRSCGDLAPGAITEIDRLRAAIDAAIGEIERGYPLSAMNVLLNAQEGLP